MKPDVATLIAGSKNFQKQSVVSFKGIYYWFCKMSKCYHTVNISTCLKRNNNAQKPLYIT